MGLLGLKCWTIIIHCFLIGSLHVVDFSWNVFARICWVKLIYPILSLVIVNWSFLFSGVFHFVISSFIARKLFFLEVFIQYYTRFFIFYFICCIKSCSVLCILCMGFSVIASFAVWSASSFPGIPTCNGI